MARADMGTDLSGCPACECDIFGDRLFYSGSALQKIYDELQLGSKKYGMFCGDGLQLQSVLRAYNFYGMYIKSGILDFSVCYDAGDRCAESDKSCGICSDCILYLYSSPTFACNPFDVRFRCTLFAAHQKKHAQTYSGVWNSPLCVQSVPRNGERNFTECVL